MEVNKGVIMEGVINDPYPFISVDSVGRRVDLYENTQAIKELTKLLKERKSMPIKITKREDSILPKKILAHTKEIKDEGYYRWIIQIFMRHEGERVVETHRFWKLNGLRSTWIIEYLAKEIRSYGLEFNVIGIAAFNGEKVIINKSVSFIPVAELEENG